MNNLRFKAWEISEKVMLNRNITDRNWYTKDDKCFCCAMPEDVRRLKIMQFTGRKDKNGVEIYLDCDIFKFKFMTSPSEHIDLVGVMTFNDEDLRVEIDIYPETDGYICLSYIGDGQFYDFEIIGTMQENPELLEG